jgi:hypothetical protein
MVPLLLAAVLWHGPATIRVPNGEVRTLEIPARAGPARLVLRAHAAYWRPAGSNPLLRIVVNGREVGLMRDRRRARLAGEPTRDSGLPRYDFGRWRVTQGPTAVAADQLALDVSDLLRAGEPTTITLDCAGAGSLGATPVIVEDLRLETGEPVETPPEAPDWRLPRLALPPPPLFQVEADRERIRVSWNGDTREIRTVVIGGPHQWERRIERFPTHIEVRDTVTNRGADVIGLRIRHAVKTDAVDIHLGGRLDPDVNDAYSPWNPTVFTPVGGAGRASIGGVGLVVEDDVFRQQLYVDFAAADDTVGIRTDMLCLAPGESHDLVWSVYPLATRSYWDFINTVRSEWQVNHMVPGSFIWFTPEAILATPPDRLRDALARQHTSIAAMLGGWVDPSRTERPPLIGFGTAVLGDAFADYRQRIQRAVRRLKEASPGVRVLLYFDAQRDSSPDAVRRYADSLLRDVDRRPERVEWSGRYSTTWGMVPTVENGFGRAMGDVARKMRDLGGDGLYWDEMDGVDFRAPRVTTSAWDGRSCALGDDAAVVAKLGLVNLLSEAVKLRYADTGFVLGNVPPTTRRFMQRPDVRMVETHLSDFGSMAHLTTPLAYIGQRADYAMVRAKIDEGLLTAGVRIDYEHDIIARMFPFTPEYIQPGTLRGRERIITTASGTHGWRRCTGEVRAFRYDAAGREHVADWRVKRTRGGGTFVRVRLQPGEAAIAECELGH